MVDVAQPLAPFLRRPPTPPKESASKLFEENSLQHNIAIRHLLDTPEESPSSSTEYFKSTPERARKKVGFSGWTIFHKPPSISTKGYDSDELRPLPPSRDCKSSKSILKLSAEHATLVGNDALLTFDNRSLPAMLRSAIHHMASDSRASRLDAYGSLLASLSTYEDVPNVQELVEVVNEITSHIRRDVSMRLGEDGSIDFQIVTQALKLVTVFCCTPSLAANVPEDFRSFIVDLSLSSLEQKLPKILVSHYMHLLERQKFGSKIMNAERTNRLLAALDTITTRVRGNRIVGHRLMIYQRLLSQAKSVMASKVESWIDHLVAGLLSTVKDIRTRAITFGIEAGLRLGTTNNVSEACLEVFNRQPPEGKKVVDLLCDRLAQMVTVKDDACHVAQIWSVMILFLRSRRQQIERWEHLKAWLIIIQRCFNSGDAQVKFQANVAWNRLIFAINIEFTASAKTTTSLSMAKMLRQPIVSQLERNRIEKSKEKNSKLTKQVARASYCTLLYYALRPTATHAQLDQYWDLYVVDLIPKSFAANKSDINHACDILAALLFGHGQPRVWNENRANMNGPIESDELPCLDSKWVRSRAGKIMQVFDELLNAADWQLESGRVAPVILSWRSFMSALGQASSKEVKVSTDALTAVAQILNQVKRSMNQMDNQRSSLEVLKRVYILVREAVSKIGNLAFNEKRIVLTEHTYFEAILETPTSRSKSIQGSPSSAALYLLELLLLNNQAHHDISDLLDLARYCVNVILQSAHFRHSQLSILRDLAQLFLYREPAFQLRPRLVLWRVIAEYASEALSLASPSASHGGRLQSLGHEYKDAVKLLELGVQQHSTDILPTWRRLYNGVLQMIDLEVGSAGTTIMVGQPLAAAVRKEIQSQCNEASITVAVSVLQKVYWPQSRQLVDRAQHQLWGTTQQGYSSITFDLVEDIYLLVNAVLIESYEAIDTLPTDTQTSAIRAVTSFMHSCPPVSRARLLGSVQSGLAIWIEDSRGAMDRRKPDVYPSIKKMWDLVANIIETVPKSGNDLLSTVNILVTASLRSRHKAILNDAIAIWNRTFGSTENVDYSEDLRKALIKLKLMADTDVPGFSKAEEQEAEFSPFYLIDSQEGNEDAPVINNIDKRPTPDVQLPQLRIPLGVRATTRGPPTARVTASPSSSARQSAKTTPTTGLRHKDAQIKFAVIESSSPPGPINDDSLLLIDRQKEVREHQGREAAMFPGRSSSPAGVAKASSSGLPKLTFKPTEAPLAGLDPDEETSPTFPPDTLMNGFLGSSPTPSSGRNRSQDRFSDNGLPSSPPLVSSYLHVRRGDSALLRERSKAPSQAAIESGGVKNRSTPPEDQADKYAAADKAEDIAGGVRQRNLPDTNILSDLDVYVDAPSEPQLASSSSPGKAQEDRTQVGVHSETVHRDADERSNTTVPRDDLHLQERPQSSMEPEVSTVMDSFRSQASSRFSTDDEQAAAQLLAEMEGAQSQQPCRSASDAVHSQASKKRKRSTKDASRKRARVSTPAQETPRVIEAPNLGEVVAECVLIEARPATGMLRAVSAGKEIKKERSTSPPAASFMSTVEETPIPDKRHSGRPRQSAARHRSSQGLGGGSRSARKVQIKAEPDDEANAPHSVPKTRTRRSRKVRGPGKVHRDTSLDPLQTDDGLLQSLTSSSGIDAPRPSGDDGAQVECPPAGRAGEIPSAAAALTGQADVRCGEGGTTAQSILEGFRGLIGGVQQVALGPEEERVMVSMLFECVQHVHEAGRRYRRS